MDLHGYTILPFQGIYYPRELGKRRRVPLLVLRTILWCGATTKEVLTRMGLTNIKAGDTYATACWEK